jgi:EAL domain-containing protein (putative c-di-GMP-specific phosphodiesterase class I)
MDMIDLAPFHPDTFSVEGEAGSTREFQLSTEFQPIFSLAHCRAVGYEGLIRAADSLGRTYAPGELLSQAPAGVARMHLDRQCRRIHIKNFQRLGDPNSWLFLNVDYVAARGKGFGPFAKVLEEFRLPAHRVAVELVETPFDDEKRLAAAFEHYRTLGCLTVIDDFGAGHSNFDRIWGLKPDIVKIDREMTHRVAVEPLARRMFSGIISVLHEAGALVCVEGIETEAEALCATDANADRCRAIALGRGARCPRRLRRLVCAALHRLPLESAEFHERRTVRLEPYVAALATRCSRCHPAQIA